MIAMSICDYVNEQEDKFYDEKVNLITSTEYDTLVNEILKASYTCSLHHIKTKNSGNHIFGAKRTPLHLVYEIDDEETTFIDWIKKLDGCWKEATYVCIVYCSFDEVEI